jgi:Zn-dependent protease
MIDFGGILITLAIILVSMTLHELMHGVVAYWLGDTTAKEDGRLTLNPLKHLDPIMSVALPLMLALMHAPIFGGAKPVPVDTRNLKGGVWGMALVALAGPLTNFILALVSFLVFWNTSGAVSEVALSAVTINLGFMVFNLFPIPPLDGSRIVYAIAPDGVRGLMKNLEQYGLFIVYILLFIFGTAFSQIMLGAINGVLKFFLLLVGAPV